MSFFRAVPSDPNAEPNSAAMANNPPSRQGIWIASKARLPNSIDSHTLPSPPKPQASAARAT